MKKILLGTLCAFLVVVCPPSQAVHHAAFTIDPDRHGVALGELKSKLGADHPLTQHFEYVIIPVADREQCQLNHIFNTELLYCLNDKKIIKEGAPMAPSYAGGIYNLRGAGPSYTLKPVDDVVGIVNRYIEVHYPTDEERAEKQAIFQGILDAFSFSLQIQRDWRENHGRWATGPFDEFVCQVLNIKTHAATGYPSSVHLKDWDNRQDNEKAFLALKESGFLSTDITTTVGYEYDPSLEAKFFLNENPNVATFVMGCGHYPRVPRSTLLNGQKVTVYTDDYFRVGGHSGEMICGQCWDAPHEGEMVASAHWIGNPDLPCDLRDPRAWAGIPDGQFSQVKDHSGYGLFECEVVLNNVHRVLREGGTVLMGYGSAGFEQEAFKNKFRFIRMVAGGFDNEMRMPLYEKI